MTPTGCILAVLFIWFLIDLVTAIRKANNRHRQQEGGSHV